MRGGWRRKVYARDVVGESLREMLSTPTVDCPDPELLVMHALRLLSPMERRRVLRHAAFCGACLKLLEIMSRIPR